MTDIQWFYARDEQQHGPVNSAELKQLATAGQLAPEDYVWREGMSQWAPAANVKGLFSEGLPAPALQQPVAVVSEPEEPPLAAPAETFVPRRRAHTGRSLSATLALVQTVLWGACVFVVLVGGLLLTVSILRSNKPEQDTAAGMLFTALFIGSYILARAGEKICVRLLATQHAQAPRQSDEAAS